MKCEGIPVCQKEGIPSQIGLALYDVSTSAAFVIVFATLRAPFLIFLFVAALLPPFLPARTRFFDFRFCFATIWRGIAKLLGSLQNCSIKSVHLYRIVQTIFCY